MRLFLAIKKFFREGHERLNKHPVAYAVVGGVGVILFWRGVWYLADFIFVFFFTPNGALVANFNQFWDGIVSTLIGSILLLGTGLFVSAFIGAQMISSDMKTEEKMVEKTEQAEKTEEERLSELESKFDEFTGHLDKHLESIEKKIDQK